MTGDLPRYAAANARVRTLLGSLLGRTGLDALAHAIEGYWSRNHQPICDLMACEALALVFRRL